MLTQIYYWHLALSFKFQNGKSVTEFLKKPPSTSPYIIISKRGNGCQTFLACGGNSILETTTISTGVAALIGSYFLFNFEYPPEAKGAFYFYKSACWMISSIRGTQSMQLPWFGTRLQPWKTLVHQWTVSLQGMTVPRWTCDHAKNMRLWCCCLPVTTFTECEAFYGWDYQVNMKWKNVCA